MKTYLLFFLLLFAISLSAQSQDKRIFIFGHSLIDHRPPAIPTPSDETTVPHWLHLLATEASHTTAIGGQYGFLPQHANVPPISQWGYDVVPGVWESDTEPFSDAEINTVLLTAGNFIQYQGPEEEYFGDPGVTPINATEAVFNWVDQQESGVDYFIYENWPDMASFLSNGTPPTASEFANYNDFLLGDFHDWWLAYHDSLRQSVPQIAPRMIPVGPIIAKLLSNPTLGLDDIPLGELYEDDAPHGRASLYFLASLVTYPAIFGEKAPDSYEVPSIVYPDIRSAYAAINDFIWAELLAFNDDEGSSRVFADNSLPVVLASFSAEAGTDDITLRWRTSAEEALDRFVLERRGEGTDFREIGSVFATGAASDYDFTDAAPLSGLNTYRLRLIDRDGQEAFSPMVVAELSTSTVQLTPLGNQRFRFSGAPSTLSYWLSDATGRIMLREVLQRGEGIIQLPVSLPRGVYVLFAFDPAGRVARERILVGY